jgi:hypothetical protein
VWGRFLPSTLYSTFKNSLGTSTFSGATWLPLPYHSNVNKRTRCNAVVAVLASLPLQQPTKGKERRRRRGRGVTPAWSSAFFVFYLTHFCSDAVSLNPAHSRVDGGGGNVSVKPTLSPTLLSFRCLLQVSAAPTKKRARQRTGSGEGKNAEQRHTNAQMCCSRGAGQQTTAAVLSGREYAEKTLAVLTSHFICCCRASAGVSERKMALRVYQRVSRLRASANATPGIANTVSPNSILHRGCHEMC